MESSPMTDETWDKVALRGLAPRSRLLVAHPKGQDHWVELALRYRRGDLEGLSKVESANTAIVRRGAGDGAHAGCYFKQYLSRDRWEPWKNLVRASRASRAWRNALLVERLGFATPRPLCLIEERQWRRLIFAALITSDIGAQPCVREVLSREPAAARADRRAFLSSLGAEVARWHGAGLYHGDLHPGNLLYAEGPGPGSFFWLDLERTMRFGRLPVRRRMDDLARLNYERLPISLTDRMRVWTAYRRQVGLPREEARALLRAVVVRTQRRWRKRGWM